MLFLRALGVLRGKNEVYFVTITSYRDNILDKCFKYIDRLLLQAKFSAAPKPEWLELSGDGSDRKFFRIGLVSGGSCLAVFPSSTLPKKEALAESCSAYTIGKHLEAKGVLVPRLFAYDEVSGGILFDDLGNTLLHDIVKKDKSISLDYYRQALNNLVVFQVKGVAGFKASYCWDTAQYDRQLMLSRESGYFQREFCYDYVGIPTFSEQLDRDFNHLADRVSKEDCRFLLHRDYQSRNLMVNTNGIFIIDFQGARFGPLGYDVASLLNDPYVGLDLKVKNELLDYYLDVLSQYISLDRGLFLKGYCHIALQRNLQVLGAYAFLTLKKKKLFFKDFIVPAFNSLSNLVDGELAGKYPGLEKLITEIGDNKIDDIAGN